MPIEDAWHQRVLGIALVVEEVGKFSKLAFRYPPSPQNSPQQGSSSSSSSRHSKVCQAHQDNVFFSLPPKVMAKLFRTKPALCGQPMTLSIGGTIFCCRSVLLNKFHEEESVDENASVHSKHSQGSSGPGAVDATSLDRLVMFSIIVAVLPTRGSTERGSTMYNRQTIDDHDQKDNDQMKEFKSQNFPVIQRIHLSLFRLCAVLQREERRCIYMSRQVAQLLEIQANTSSQTGEGSSDDNKRNNEYNEAEVAEIMITAKSPKPVTVDIGTEEEASRRTYRRYSIPLHGNLAAELADTYFALARNDVAFRSSPASLLTGRDGIIYINLHISVNIEAASKRENSDKQFRADASIPDHDMLKALRPYHTILFPTVSSDELLQNITTTASNSDGDLSQRILQKLLLVCDPFKSLYDMSLETALPLSAMTEAATSLIDSGACIAVPVIQSSTRFACQSGAIKMMSSLKLEFAQQFTPVCPIFVVVAALTSTKKCASNGSTNKTKEPCAHASFGDVIRYCREGFAMYHTDDLSSSDNESEVSYRSNEIPAEIQMLMERLVATLSAEQINSGQDIEIGADISFQDVESLLISMTTWLRSHSVIVELKNYFVAINPLGEEKCGNDKQQGFKKKGKSLGPGDVRASSLANGDLDAIFKECFSKNYMDGSVSSAALAWRLGITALRTESLREYGVRENRLQVVTRIPCSSDDWSAP